MYGTGLLLLLLGTSFQVIAQQNINTATNQKVKVSVVFGLSQPLFTKGFNAEINYYTRYFVFDYSHGFNLHFQNKMVSEDSRQQQLKYKISHSLGFGVGYRITPDFNLRVEPKIHLWQLYYDKQSYANQNIIKKYAVYTLGLGAYYRLLPFKNAGNFIKGITVVPSMRWWPNIKTTLPDNKFTYFNSRTGKTEIHKANNIGVNNTPFFGNISLGYSF